MSASYPLLIAGKYYTHAQIAQVIELVEEIAREAPKEPAWEPTKPENLIAWIRKHGKLPEAHILTGEEAINLLTNGAGGDDPLTTWGQEYKAHEIGERCAAVLREIRGYV